MMVPDVIVNDNTININGNIVTLTLSWGEPFDNFDPIVAYTVSCSGDVTCPPSFMTDNTTRSYIITNLTPMTDYTFSVVATNSVGSGEAGVVMITTPGEFCFHYVKWLDAAFYLMAIFLYNICMCSYTMVDVTFSLYIRTYTVQLHVQKTLNMATFSYSLYKYCTLSLTIGNGEAKVSYSQIAQLKSL